MVAAPGMSPSPGAIAAPRGPKASQGSVDFAARGAGLLAGHLDLAFALLKDIYLKSEPLAELLNIN